MTALAPAASLTLGVGLIGAAYASESMLVVAAVVGAASVLVAGAPRRPGVVYLVAGGLGALGLIVLTPLVGADSGNTLLVGPELPVVDTEVTLQELARGAVLGGRLLAVTLIVGLVVAMTDGDRLHDRVAQLAPRSALLIALSARLLPTLEADARALSERHRLRGEQMGGRWSHRVRGAARLATPLAAASLERSLDITEAMVARGGLAGRATPADWPPLTRTEWLVAIGGAVVVGLAGATAVVGVSPIALAVCAPLAAIVAIGAWR